MLYICCGNEKRPLSHQELLRAECCGEHSYKYILMDRIGCLVSSVMRVFYRGPVSFGHVWSPCFMNEAIPCSYCSYFTSQDSVRQNR